MYEPTFSSVKQHPLPAWYDDAKFGIFIHWGLYSVPAFAPRKPMDLQSLLSGDFGGSPYAEWYQNNLRINGSAVQQYHAEKYGASFPYESFAAAFNAQSRGWNPEAWADAFQRARARYVVLVTKHHDGFLMWPSRQPNPFKQAYQAERDLVGELSDAVRARGMRMGLYYSGGLDWTFNDHVIVDIADLFVGVPQSDDYVQYADGHWRELIERHHPAVLWNDIAYPAAADLPQLFADYYNRFPDGVVNNRFTQRFEFDPNTSAIVNLDHYDFDTPEYATSYSARKEKWEATRGLGFSFGYNQNEGPEHLLTLERLVHSFVDIVSKNGNLLLNVGPMADGTIPPLQRDTLLRFGKWLEVNGEALFDTRPWAQAEGCTAQGAPVHFTDGGGPAYAIILASPQGGEVAIESLRADADASVHLLGHEPALRWRQDGDDLAVTLPDALPEDASAWPAYALRITPAPDSLI